MYLLKRQLTADEPELSQLSFQALSIASCVFPEEQFRGV
jgi:hypothetical protein